MGTLNDLVRGRRQGMPLIRNREIVRQILSGVAHLHAEQIIHRDLNSFNILVSFSSGTVGELIKLTDFGMSRIVRENCHSVARTVMGNGYSIVLGPCGTEDWMAPEISNNQQNYTNKIDIFSSGCVIGFIFLKGIHPFSPNPQSRIQNNQPMTLLPEQLNDDDRVAFDLIQSMFSAEPSSRPSAAQVLQHEYFQRCSDTWMTSSHQSLPSREQVIS